MFRCRGFTPMVRLVYEEDMSWIISECELMRAFIKLVPIVVLIIITVLSTIIGSGTVQSKALTIEKTETENQIRQDYVDSSGRITFASDKGYASVIETKLSDREAILQYLDEEGWAVELAGGYDTIHAPIPLPVRLKRIPISSAILRCSGSRGIGSIIGSMGRMERSVSFSIWIRKEI